MQGVHKSAQSITARFLAVGLVMAAAASTQAGVRGTQYPDAALSTSNQIRLPGETGSIIGPVFDSGGFDSYTNGNLVGQQTWAAYTPATGNGYQVTGTGDKYVAASLVGTNYAFPSNPVVTPAANEGLSVNIDIARTVAATAATSTPSYGVGVYDPAGNLTTEFGLSRNSSSNAIGVYVTAPFNTTTGQFQAGQPVFNVTVASGLTAGSFYNLEARLNYASKTVDIFSAGDLFLGGVPFAANSATFSDADLTVNGGLTGDVGAFDSYVVSTIAVPEPATLSVLGAAGAMLLRRRR